MADMSIGELPVAEAFDAATLLPIYQDGSTAAISGAALAEYIAWAVPDHPYISYTLNASGSVMRATLVGFESVPGSIFRGLSWLSFVSARGAQITAIGRSAFAECIRLSYMSFPECLTIGVNAFYNCRALPKVDFPMVSIINYGTFQDCSSLAKINFPACSLISHFAFSSCSSLTEINFPACSLIGAYAFANCRSLSQISFPVCSTVSEGAFQYCSSIEKVSFPMLSSLSGATFTNCHNLADVNLPMCTHITNYAFNRCFNLLSVSLLGSSVCTLAASAAFSSTPIAGYTASTGGVYGSIYVPASLYSDYISATNWAYFSERFVSV